MNPKIADYDSVNYDYEKYWNGQINRDYEDMADKIALNRLLKKEDKLKRKLKIKSNDDLFIDIGGSYGRELDIYSKYFKRIIILDYSFESLKKAIKYSKEKKLGNVYFIAANVYALPFKKSSIDSGSMVRVMHHLKYTNKALSEINRVIGGFFVLEFANKINFKFKVRSILKGKAKDIFNTESIQQKFRETSQGSKGDNQIFLNFHPKYILEELKKTNFRVIYSLDVSNFRMPVIKRMLGKNVLVLIERIAQRPLAYINFGPSIYYLLKKKSLNTKINQKITDTFCCPKCKGGLLKNGNIFTCKSCSLNFNLKEGIYDFRYIE